MDMLLDSAVVSSSTEEGRLEEVNRSHHFIPSFYILKGSFLALFLDFALNFNDMQFSVDELIIFLGISYVWKRVWSSKLGKNEVP